MHSLLCVKLAAVLEKQKTVNSCLFLSNRFFVRMPLVPYSGNIISSGLTELPSADHTTTKPDAK